MKKSSHKLLCTRNISLLLNVLLLGAVAFLWIETKNDISASPACNVENCYNYEANASFQGLTLGFLSSLSTEYNNKMMAVPNFANIPDDQLPDSRSIWFPLETLQRFIWGIRKNSCKPGCPPLDTLGVRIYFGRYTNPGLVGLPPEYKDRHTLFMVPTFYNGTAHCDFDPKHYSETSGCTPYTLKQRFGNADKDNLASQNVLALTITGQNHGGLCPPKCKPSPDDDFFTEHFLP